MLHPDIGQRVHPETATQPQKLRYPHAERGETNAEFARMPRPHESIKTRKALLSMTLEERDVFRVRRALGQSEVEFIKLTRIRKDSRVRLQIALDARRISEAMSRIIGCLDTAEFGRITFV